jgi:hypothetical protein
MKNKERLQMGGPRSLTNLKPSLLVRSAVRRSRLVLGSVEDAAQTYVRFAVRPFRLMGAVAERVAGSRLGDGSGVERTGRMGPQRPLPYRHRPVRIARS